MSQGVLYSAALNQGVGNATDIMRLLLAQSVAAQNAREEAERVALAREIEARRVDEFSQRQALDLDRFTLDQTRENRLGDAHQFGLDQALRAQEQGDAQRNAMGGLLGSLGVNFADPSFVGPTTPEAPAPSVDLAALDPETQRMLAQDAIRLRADRMRTEDAAAALYKKRAELIDTRDRLETQLQRMGPNNIKQGPAMALHARITDELARVTDDIAASEIAIRSQEYGLPPGTTAQITERRLSRDGKPEADTLKLSDAVASAEQGVLRSLDQLAQNDRDVRNPTLERIAENELRQFDSALRRDIKARTGLDPGSFYERVAGHPLMKLRTGDDRLRLTMDRMREEYGRALSGGASPDSAASPSAGNETVSVTPDEEAAITELMIQGVPFEEALNKVKGARP